MYNHSDGAAGRKSTAWTIFFLPDLMSYERVSLLKKVLMKRVTSIIYSYHQHPGWIGLDEHPIFLYHHIFIPPNPTIPFIISIPLYFYLLRRRQGRSAWMGRQRMNLHLILICQSWRRNKARETVVLIYRGLVFDTNFFQVFAPEVVSAVRSWWPRWQSPSSFLEGRCFFLTSGSIKRCRTKNINILRIEDPDIHLGNVHVKDKFSVCWHY